MNGNGSGWVVVMAATSLLLTNPVDEGDPPPAEVSADQMGCLRKLNLGAGTFTCCRWWSDYLVGERASIILSFVAKSVLAWQLCANVLIPE